eukprot:m.185764 g.185764  ORF g.185764 m.185764 type:complete len:203 (-) comp16559_c0_seq1:58-666(-)
MDATSKEALRLRGVLDEYDVAPDGTAPARVEELKRFLALKAAHKDVHAALLSPSGDVDELWHALILDTMLYKEVCEALLREGGFIHHNPRGAESGREARLRRTARAYQRAFAPKDPLPANTGTSGANVLTPPASTKGKGKVAAVKRGGANLTPSVQPKRRATSTDPGRPTHMLGLNKRHITVKVVGTVNGRENHFRSVCRSL